MRMYPEECRSSPQLRVDLPGFRQVLPEFVGLLSIPGSVQPVKIVVPFGPFFLLSGHRLFEHADHRFVKTYVFVGGLPAYCFFHWRRNMSDRERGHEWISFPARNESLVILCDSNIDSINAGGPGDKQSAAQACRSAQ